MIGVSLGGHFAYALALRLKEMGREIAMLCAIDSFIVDSSQHPRSCFAPKPLPATMRRGR